MASTTSTPPAPEAREPSSPDGRSALTHAMIARAGGDEALAQEAAAVAATTYELSQLLTDVLGVHDAAAQLGSWFPHRVTYHPSCHGMRLLRLGDRQKDLVASVGDIDFVELSDAEECCGFGGTFAVKNAEVSVAMGTDKARHVTDTGAEVLVAGDNSCLAHIGGILGRQHSGIRRMHLAEILASTEEDPA